MKHRLRVLAILIALLAVMVSGMAASGKPAQQRQAVSHDNPQRTAADLSSISSRRSFTLLGKRRPTQRAVADSRAAEIGMRFRVTRPGRITAIRFFKGRGNAGVHRGTLWNSSGRALATVRFRNESRRGWQLASLRKPVVVRPRTKYTVSYRAPRGHWSVTNEGFSNTRRSGPIRAPRKAGRFSRTHTMPTRRVGTRNLFVDVVWRPLAPRETASALSLPLLEWEGGPDYWTQFPQTRAAGWNKDYFFPIVLWFNGISTDAEAAFDKSKGFNTYIGMDGATDFRLFRRNGVYWIGDALKNADASSPFWVGDFLDDEVDGRFTAEEGFAHLQGLVDERTGNGRFKYANFTQIIMSAEGDQEVAETYTNRFTDAVSLDMYWYTIPFCSSMYRDIYITPVTRENCRTASSYGKTMESLRKRDAADGNRQALWQFVEILNGGPGDEAPAVYITPEQVKGAVMNSIINEARGIVYFNQSFSGPCRTSGAVRSAQIDPRFCGTAQVEAAGQVNNLVHSLAPVINTQTYVWDFGPGLDTMLKVHENYAYVFAMIDGHSLAGPRVLALPPEVSGRTVEVIGEGRTLPVTAEGTFRDVFSAESTFHIYRVDIS